MVFAKEKVVKKAKGNSSKKVKMSEVDKVFKDTVEYWKDLAGDITWEFHDIEGALNLIREDSSEHEVDDLINFMRVVKRSMEVTTSKAEKLFESLCGVSIIKPIDEIEGKVIGALRVLGKGKGLINWPGDKAGFHKSLVPLFKLAEEEGYSFPEWLRDHADLPKDE